MIRLQDLLPALTAVIIRYYDHKTDKKLVNEPSSDLAVKMAKAREHSLILLNNASEPYEQKLQDLINQIPGRQHLLTYIRSEIIYLKNMIDSKSSCPAEVFEQQKTHLSQMLIDFKILLSKKRNQTHIVNGIALEGLIKMDWITNGSAFCESGKLIINALEQIKITPNSTDQEIRDTVDFLCINHQNAVKAAEAEEKIRTLELSLNETKKQLSDLSLSYDKEKANTSDLSTRLSISTGEQTNLILSLTNAQSRIKELEKQLRDKKAHAVSPSEKASAVAEPSAFNPPLYPNLLNINNAYSPRLFHAAGLSSKAPSDANKTIDKSTFYSGK